MRSPGQEFSTDSTVSLRPHFVAQRTEHDSTEAGLIPG